MAGFDHIERLVGYLVNLAQCFCENWLFINTENCRSAGTMSVFIGQTHRLAKRHNLDKNSDEINQKFSVELERSRLNTC